MGNLEEAVRYFKNNDGYIRLFKAIKNKYISFGEFRGNITIINPNEIEKQAISGLMKKDYSKNKTITVNLKKFDIRLQETKFSGICLRELLEKYFKEKIVTKKESILKYNDEIQLFFRDILEQNKNTYIEKYLIKIIENKDSVYKNIKMYYNNEKEETKKEFLNACNGINNLPKQKTRIPVFANSVLSNPHGFDKDTLCGKIFIMLLCYIKKFPKPKNSEQLLELYYENNLLIDDISSTVLCKNLVGITRINEYGIMYTRHEGWKGFDRYNEPIFLTFHNLSNVEFVKDENNYKKVFVMENPAVFMGVAEKCKIKDFPLICTFGQVRIAGIALLDLLVKGNYKIYYSGDLDPEGIQIADKLKKRYKNNLEFFGFDVDTYNKNISSVSLPANRLGKLKSVKSKELLPLCDKIRNTTKVSYEEQNIDNIVNFINVLEIS